MRHVDILVTSDIDNGMAPFTHGDLLVKFHKWTQSGDLPFVEGSLWAFVDWLLPDISGLEICRRLRCDPLTAQAHITIILDEDDVETRRRSMRAGADDYFIGPVTRASLLDRVLALRRSEIDSRSLRALTVGDLSIDLAAFQARWKGKPIPLSPNDFRLLRFFAEHPGRVFTRSQLISALGKHELPMDERTVDVWVGRLRRSLKAAGVGYPMRTVRSLGYIFDLN